MLIKFAKYMKLERIANILDGEARSQKDTNRLKSYVELNKIKFTRDKSQAGLVLNFLSVVQGPAKFRKAHGWFGCTAILEDH